MYLDCRDGLAFLCAVKCLHVVRPVDHNPAGTLQLRLQHSMRAHTSHRQQLFKSHNLPVAAPSAAGALPPLLKPSQQHHNSSRHETFQALNHQALDPVETTPSESALRVTVAARMPMHRIMHSHPNNLNPNLPPPHLPRAGTIIGDAQTHAAPCPPNTLNSTPSALPPPHLPRAGAGTVIGAADALKLAPHPVQPRAQQLIQQVSVPQHEPSELRTRDQLSPHGVHVDAAYRAVRVLQRDAVACLGIPVPGRERGGMRRVKVRFDAAVDPHCHTLAHCRSCASAIPDCVVIRARRNAAGRGVVLHAPDGPHVASQQVPQRACV